jgi:hypothetical protein
VAKKIFRRGTCYLFFSITSRDSYDENFDIVHVIEAEIGFQTRGLLQVDDEGFLNEDGYHILWQFPSDINGSLKCAVLKSSGKWEKFIMDLGDETQRREFQAGLVPKRARRC